MIETLRRCVETPDVRYVVRIHPAEVKIPYVLTQERMDDQIQAAFPDPPREHRADPPEDDLSSYSLAAASDLAVMYSSTSDSRPWRWAYRLWSPATRSTPARGSVWSPGPGPTSTSSRIPRTCRRSPPRSWSVPGGGPTTCSSAGCSSLPDIVNARSHRLASGSASSATSATGRYAGLDACCNGYSVGNTVGGRGRSVVSRRSSAARSTSRCPNRSIDKHSEVDAVPASQTILVTGGAGYIGSTLTRELLAARAPRRRRGRAAVRRRIAARPPVAPGLHVLEDRHHRHRRSSPRLFDGRQLRRRRPSRLDRRRPGLQGAARAGRAHHLGRVHGISSSRASGTACAVHLRLHLQQLRQDGGQGHPRRGGAAAAGQPVRGAQGEVRAVPAGALDRRSTSRSCGSPPSTASRCGRASISPSTSSPRRAAQGRTGDLRAAVLASVLPRRATSRGAIALVLESRLASWSRARRSTSAPTTRTTRNG